MIQKKTTLPVAKAPKKQQKKASAPVSHGVGRRKNAIARVWVYKGSGKFTVNHGDLGEYFDTNETRVVATTISKVYPASADYDVAVNVIGGGKVGQAAAIMLGTARAFLLLDETMRPLFRQHNMLTVDSRNKERKKYGQRGARRKFQFVKR